MDLLDNGYNPLKWNCKEYGCFNQKCRPKVEIFCDCFPRRISFGDIDWWIEINGKELRLEWKNKKGDIPKGQYDGFLRLSQTGIITVFCVVGDPETMEVFYFALFYKGKFRDWEKCNLEELKSKMKNWVKYHAKDEL